MPASCSDRSHGIGAPMLKVTAPAGYDCVVLNSTNLVEWAPAALGLGSACLWRATLGVPPRAPHPGAGRDDHLRPKSPSSGMAARPGFAFVFADPAALWSAGLRRAARTRRRDADGSDRDGRAPQFSAAPRLVWGARASGALPSTSRRGLRIPEPGATPASGRNRRAHGWQHGRDSHLALRTRRRPGARVCVAPRGLSSARRRRERPGRSRSPIRTGALANGCILKPGLGDPYQVAISRLWRG